MAQKNYQQSQGSAAIGVEPSAGLNQDREKIFSQFRAGQITVFDAWHALLGLGISAGSVNESLLYLMRFRPVKPQVAA